MSMTSTLLALLQKANVAQSFIDYLESIGCDDAMSFALLADDEKGVRL